MLSGRSETVSSPGRTKQPGPESQERAPGLMTWLVVELSRCKVILQDAAEAEKKGLPFLPRRFHAVCGPGNVCILREEREQSCRTRAFASRSE